MYTVSSMYFQISYIIKNWTSIYNEKALDPVHIRYYQRIFTVCWYLTCFKIELYYLRYMQDKTRIKSCNMKYIFIT